MSMQGQVRFDTKESRLDPKSRSRISMCRICFERGAGSTRCVHHREMPGGKDDIIENSEWRGADENLKWGLGKAGRWERN